MEGGDEAAAGAEFKVAEFGGAPEQALKTRAEISPHNKGNMAFLSSKQGISHQPNLFSQYPRGPPAPYFQSFAYKSQFLSNSP
jgi:hypothetical protein